MMKKLLLLFACGLSSIPTSLAQHPTDLLKIMVVPYVARGESIPAKIDTSDLYRVAINAMHSKLEDLGYTIIDYMEWLEVLKNSGSRVQRDPETQRILNAPADVYIYIELLRFVTKSNGEKSLSIQLSANDKYSGDRYATAPLLNSTSRNWPDFIGPVNEIFKYEEELNGFLKKFDGRLKNVLENGRTMSVKIIKSAGCKIALDQPYPGSTESPFEQITSWVQKKSARPDVLLQPNEEPNLLVIDFKAPLVSFSLNDFSNELTRLIQNMNTHPSKPKTRKKIVRAQVEITIE